MTSQWRDTDVTNITAFAEMNYDVTETLFLKNCKSKGAQVLNGHRMLTCQALKSWEIWNQLE